MDNKFLYFFQGGEVVGEISKKELSNQSNTNTLINNPEDVDLEEKIKKICFKDTSTYKKVKNIEDTKLSDVVSTINYSSSSSQKTRILLCGTYPIGQSNGYSRVVYYIAKHLGIEKYNDIQLTIYGFQNFRQTAGSEERNEIPSSVILHDALATENPKRGGFGEKEIGIFLRKNPQDIIIIFNDPIITSGLTQTIVQEFSNEERKKFLLVSYMDQVYPYQKPEYINIINTYFNAVITFTPYWKQMVRKLGLRKDMPCYMFPHGFDHNLYYPIPRDLARLYYNIPQNAFVILNLNRNQPRKRWDLTIMAFAEVIENYYKLLNATPEEQRNTIRPVRLMIGSVLDGSWSLLEILKHELMLRNVPYEFGRECIVAVSNPQQLSDRDINVMYNACDIGLNTCEGEGFGLCQLEHMGVGSPQVCLKIGGLQDFLNENNSIVIEPTVRYFIDKQRDGIGGVAEIAGSQHFATAIWKYYENPDLVKKHSKEGRKEILQHYKWNVLVEHFHNVLNDIWNKRNNN